MKCCICKKKDIKYIMMERSSMKYGFCSKTCIANRSIEYFNIRKLNKGEKIK